MSTETITEHLQEGEYTITEVKNTVGILHSAEIDTQIATAKAYPRSLTAFKQRALSLATISQEVAESCEYALPRGNKLIKGPSVRLAEIVFGSYGNMRAGARVVNNNGRTITSQGICFDLETNTCITIEVTRSIMQHEKKWSETAKKLVNTGKMVPMNDDMQVLIGNAASSVALRNAIFRVVPKAAWNDVYEQVKVVAKGDAKTLPERRAKAVEFFTSRGVKTEIICATLGVKGVDDIDLDILANLSAMKASLVNGEATLESLFPPPDAKKKTEDAQEKLEDKLKKEQEKKDNRGKNAAAKTLDKIKSDLANPEAGQ